MRKVFLSSTYKDLIDHRKALFEAIESLDGYYCVRMETFGARDWESLDFCRKKVAECDLFVGILGHLYGSCPKESAQSYTEAEYETAALLGIPRLMFIAHEHIELPVNMREPDDLWRRQKAFRDRVSQKQVRDVFDTPESVALKVVQAIRNWELSHHPNTQKTESPASWKMQHQTLLDRRPDLGSLVSKMCDRTKQEEAFSDFFTFQIRQRPGSPQIYIIHGDENECPESLVERFRDTTIQNYANHKWQQRAAILRKEVKWSDEGELAQRQKRLVSELFKRFDNTYEFEHDDFSARAFIQLRALALHPVIVIEHQIRGGLWNQSTRGVLELYLNFWDSVSRLKPKPQFLIFFVVSYPLFERFWRGWFKRRFDKGKIQRDLTEIERSRQDLPDHKIDSEVCRCLVLDELLCIDRDEVMNWFRQHKVFDDRKIWQGRCDQIFKEGDCRPMADIEYELKLIHREFITQKGQL